jgi:hypothetical protein
MYGDDFAILLRRGTLWEQMKVSRDRATLSGISDRRTRAGVGYRFR